MRRISSLLTEKLPEFGTNTEVPAISVRIKYILFSSIFMISTGISVFLMLRYWQVIAELSKYGYIGAFLIAFIAGSSLPTPISYLLIIFTLGGILDPILVGLSAGVGAGIGGTLVYLLGRGGRRVLPGLKHYSIDQESNKLVDKFVYWGRKRGSVVVFVMSAMLNPVFAPMAVAMGAIRFRLLKFLLMCIAGNTLKALIIAYAGYWGVGYLKRFFG